MFEYSLRKRDNSKINEDTDLDLRPDESLRTLDPYLHKLDSVNNKAQALTSWDSGWESQVSGN